MVNSPLSSNVAFIPHIELDDTIKSRYILAKTLMILHSEEKDDKEDALDVDKLMEALHVFKNAPKYWKDLLIPISYVIMDMKTQVMSFGSFNKDCTWFSRVI